MKRTARRLLAAAAALAALAALPSAAAPSFLEPRVEALGPAGGSLRSLAVGADGTAYAGAQGGPLFRRPASGERWQTLHPYGPESGARHGLFALETDPLDPAVVYAGTYQRLYRSADHGESWERLPIGLEAGDLILSIAADPLTPGRVYVGSFRGVRVSSDGGQTWTASDLSFETTTLVPDPEMEGRAFALAAYHLFRSLDGGLTWREVAGGLPEIAPITAIEYVPAGGGAAAGLYAALRLPQSGSPQVSRLFRVAAGGTELEEVAPLPGLGRALLADPADPSHLLLGTEGGDVWTSGDRGLTWTEAAGPEGEAAVYLLAADPTTPGLFYAGRPLGGGLARSTDGGARWDRDEAGLYASSAELVGLDPAGWRYYAQVDGREPQVRSAPARGSRNGDGWRPLDGPFSGLDDRLLGVHPLRPRELFVAATEPEGAALFRSRNRGRSWEKVASPTDGFGVGAPEEMWFHPTLPDRLYLWQLDTPQGLHRSDDGGDSFTFLGYHPPRLDFDPDDENLIYSSGTLSGLSSDPTVAYAERSFDGGVTWERLEGVPEGSIGGLLRVQPTTGDVFFLVDDTLYRSRDRGLTWQPAGISGRAVTALAFHPTDSRVIYAAAARTPSSSAGLYVSTNGGAGWTFLDLGLATPRITSLRTFAAAPNTVFAGTDGEGIQRIVFPPRSAGEAGEAGPHDCPDGGRRRLCYRGHPRPEPPSAPHPRPSSRKKGNLP